LALAGGIGVIDMELLSVIRRWHYRDHFSIREISRRTGLSRNTVRKYLRSDSVEPKFAVPDRPSRLDPYAVLQNFDIGAAAALGIVFLVFLSVIMQQLLGVIGRNTDILED
jgi:transcriptional regulator with XRE-family HTH domain